MQRFRFSFRSRSAPLHRDVEAELGKLLFATIIPAIVIGLSTASFAGLLWLDTGRPALAAIVVASILVTIYRLTCNLSFRVYSTSETQGLWEKAYAAGNFGFAGILAAFSWLAFDIPGEAVKLMVAILAITNCAGMVTLVSARPKIAIIAVLISAAPLAVACAIQGSPQYVTIAIVLVAMIIGAIDTIWQTYHVAAEQLTARQRFADLASLDGLTGLPNRTMLISRLDQIFSARNRGNVAIHFVDLDNFKPINDTFGHAAGDQILIAVAQRLQTALTEDAFVARVGGDEFVVVQPVVSGLEAAQFQSQRIINAVSAPIRLEQTTVVVRTSNGCFVADIRTISPAEALAAADAALYEAKRGGRNRGVVRDSLPEIAA